MAVATFLFLPIFFLLMDFDKVAEYRKSLGYYQIVTSELTMDAQEVIGVSI